MALNVKRSTCIDCGVVAITDLTGAYDAESNPGGYGTPNPDIDDEPYTAEVYLPGATTPAFTLNLLSPLPAPDEDGHYRWEITVANLGIEELTSGVYKVVITQGGVTNPQFILAYGDLQEKINKCICCSGVEHAVLDLELTAAIKLFECGKLDQCKAMINELYRKTKACCGCGCN